MPEHLARHDLEWMTGEQCHKDKFYLYFLIPCLVLFFLGIFIILIYRLILFLVTLVRRKSRERRKHDNQKRVADVLGISAGTSARNSVGNVELESVKGNVDPILESVKDKRFQRWARWVMRASEKIVSGQTITGKLLMALSGVVIFISILIYLIDTTHVLPTEKDMTLTEEPLRIIELACNVFFLLYFIPKFLAAYDKLKFWLQWFCVADIFTIPASFTAIAIGRQWIGLKFVCFFRILKLPDYLQAFTLLNTSNEIRLAEFVSIFFCVWLSAAGFIHLLENSGSPTACYEDMAPITFWNSFYYVLITMSTVGYGDISCNTIGGKIFIIVFILLSVALFARFFSEMADIVASVRQPYVVEYQKVVGVRHFIVGGSISLSTAKNVVSDITHPDRTKTNHRCIFFQNKTPSTEILSLFKRHYTKIGFIQGSLMKAKDLDRIKLQDAMALIIMTNEASCTPDEEDTGNIMKAISAKTHCPNIRIILQLIKQENKSLCYNLPFWSRHDQIICLTEINMGFMAAGCLAPGFATLLTNLLIPVSSQKSSSTETWQNEYLKGVEMEVYAEKFSNFFHGRSLDSVVRFCYKRLKLMLVGASNVRDKNSHVNPSVILNPGSDFFITQDTVGFFFCPSEQHTKGVKYYCFKCHSKKAADLIKACRCPTHNMNQLLVKAEQLGVWSKKRQISPTKLTTTATHEMNNNNVDVVDLEEEEVVRKRKMMLQMESVDFTGCYHWCADRNLEECVLDVKGTGLSQHIILCSLEFSPGSLRSFVLPLRVSSLKINQLKAIVILVEDLKELSREWKSVRNLPDLFVQMGSPLNRSVLRTLNIGSCHMFVVMSTLSARVECDDSQALLITLNAKTISALPQREGAEDQSFLQIIRSLSYMRQISSLHGVSQPESTIPILTELIGNKSSGLLDTSGDSCSNNAFYCERSYACGRVFISRVFDTLTTATFFSPETYKLVRMFIAGTDSVDHELLYAEGISQTMGNISPVDMPVSYKQCIIMLLPLHTGVLQPFANGTFESIFTNAYTEFGIMCIGLYRLISLYDHFQTSAKDRFVLTNPSPDLQLDLSDLVYCLCPPVLTLNRSPDQRPESAL